MLRSSTVKALIVLGISAAGLVFSPRDAEGFFVCDFWYNGPCNGWPQPQTAQILCAQFCPGAVLFICDSATGKWRCVSAPE